ncbi:MAG TPA: cardiolipin synthase, partial [Caldilineaceae bacterium]|nr:cardiolipin synthase [Caldilineaceae bacterium]
MELLSNLWQFIWEWLGWILLLFFSLLPFLLRLLGILVIPEQQKKRYPHAWLLLIFFLPVIGWLLYLLIGSPKLSRRRRAQQRYADEVIRQRVEEAQEQPALAALLSPPLPERHEGIIHLNEKLGGLPTFGGNNIELFPDYMGALQHIAATIDGAQRYVHVQYFMFADDESGSLLVDALIRAQARGVKTRVLVDHIGNTEFNKPLIKRLSEGGVEWHYMLPFSVFKGKWNRPDLRNHRKIVIIDGETGFTGSQNAINNTYNKESTIKQGIYYEEVVAQVSGPLVLQLQAVFATDWYSETGVLLDRSNFPELVYEPQAAGGMLAQVLPSGPGHETENNLKLFIALVHEAREKVVIITPYFVPDNALLAAMQIAAQRGVQVTLIVSGIADQFLVSRAQWSFYEELLEAGVEIREVDPPVILHAKNMSIDDHIVVIGSSNMDMRSFELNLEVTTIWYDPDAVAKLRVVEASYIDRSHPVDLKVWRMRPFSKRFVE